MVQIQILNLIKKQTNKIETIVWSLILVIFQKNWKSQNINFKCQNIEI